MKKIAILILFGWYVSGISQEVIFNKEETLKLMSNGESTIEGVVFAKDNQAPIKGLAIININKKQFAPQGTEVVLIPYTDFFQYWLDYNKKAAKKNQEPLPLPEGAAECLLKTTVKGKKGEFEFTGLPAGEYFLISEFNFIRTKSTTRVEGYTHSYLGGMYIGSAPIERIYHYNVNDMAFAIKKVEIKTNGEVVKAKVRDTDSLF